MSGDTAAPRDAGGNPIPLLTFSEAIAVGELLHDHWEKQSGAAPLDRGDLAWGDVVQFVLRSASAKWRERSFDGPSSAGCDASASLGSSEQSSPGARSRLRPADRGPFGCPPRAQVSSVDPDGQNTADGE